jgi:archaellum biogenesis ATPase FlaH
MADFDSEKKQRLLIEYLISSPDTYALCQNIVSPAFFDPALRNSVGFIKKYYQDYNTTPSTDQIEAETDQKFVLRDIVMDKVKWTCTEIETFCRRKAIEKAIYASPELIAKGDYGTVETQIREAVMLSLNANLGLRYFEDPQARLQELLDSPLVEPTGWTEVDALLYGGISRGELFLVSANSGGGKSITLANLGFNFLARKKNVLYISLELSEPVIAQRYDTMFTGISRRDWKGHVSEIATRVHNAGSENGILDIKQMPSGTNSAAIRAYLKEYYLHHKFLPDLLIVDYLDEMSPNEQVDAGNAWLKDKMCASQLRQLGVDHNIAVATASQLNREAVNAAQHNHSHIAGGISKINICDVYISIKFTETMRLQNEIFFSLQKTRNSDGVGKGVFLKWDPKRLRIIDKEGGSFIPPSMTTKKDTKEGLLGTASGSGLLDMIARSKKN